MPWRHQFRAFSRVGVGAAEGFALGVAGGLARKAGAPDGVVNFAQAAFSSGRIVYGIAKDPAKAINRQ